MISISNGHTLMPPRQEAPPPRADAPAWDTEVFVLAAAERDALRRRVQDLADHLDHYPDVSLKNLAFTLNTDAGALSGASRLAVVAGSAGELQTRLRRAAERLGDPKCRSIKDTQGIYYFDQPLYPEGKLAVLFPGEGAQYVNMLADLLPHFPEVGAHFERCDRLRVVRGNEPVCPHIFLPATASEPERTAAEKNLWRLGNAVSSILISEWAIYIILRELGLEPDVIGGHSAGEFSALLAAGCMEPDDFFIEQLAALCQHLQGLEDDGQLAEMALVAVGTARRTVLDLLGPDAGVFIAMDNCPHQTVVACRPDAMPTVERLLGERSIPCERLPFRRPYHTPLFEPFLPPFVAMYERLPVRSPRLPLYSCTTGQLYPTDPSAIRRLAIAHWAAPVEFIRMAETMYADGVRVFVEAGPRGNLTSFLEDVLRGRPVAAVAANVLRRSGVTQLNHLASQLLAHHVPLRLEHFYRRRDPHLVAWAKNAGPVGAGLRAGPETGAGTEAVGRHGDRPLQAPPRAAVLQQYWGVMGQFLDLQREVMEQYLAGRRERPATTAPVRPLLGEIVRHDVGQTLVMRRCVDLQEDLYATHHTLGGRHASAVDPDHNGLPVMPMAFSMETMAEAAAALLPGQVVIGMRRLRLHRWIWLDEDPVSLEITAQVLPDQPGHVAVTIRDLGNASHPLPAETPSVEGVVVLSDRYPDAPPQGDFPLTREGPCRFTPDQLYTAERRMFHGPLFQAVCGTDRQGEEGIEGRLVTLPHAGLFRSTPAPNLLTDPLLIDASTHLLGCWHLGRPDQTGRVVFPYELGAVDLFGPPPPAGTQLLCRVRIERSSARQVSHRIELIAPDGRLWCRLAPAEYWRFYWPKEYVEFFRFKERYLLGQPWPSALPADIARGAHCLRIEPPHDLRQPVKRAAVARITLTPDEWRQFYALDGTDRERNDWLFGRIVAKDAVRSLWRERHNQQLCPADIELTPGPHGGIVPRYRGSPLSENLPAVSFALAGTGPGGTAVALAAVEQYVGVGLEPVRERDAVFKETEFDATERKLLDDFGPARAEGIARFRCARRAVLQALRPVLADDPRGVAVRGADLATGRILVALGPELVDLHPEFRLDLLVVCTVREGDEVLAATFCERANP